MSGCWPGVWVRNLGGYIFFKEKEREVPAMVEVP